MDKKTMISAGIGASLLLSSCGTYHDKGDPSEKEIEWWQRGIQVVFSAVGYTFKKGGEELGNASDYINSPEGQEELRKKAASTTKTLKALGGAIADGVNDALKENEEADSNSAPNPEY